MSVNSMRGARLLSTLSLLLSAVAVVLAAIALLGRNDTPAAGAQMSTNFEAQVRAYLLDNPEIIIESVQRLDEQQEAVEVDELKAALAQNGEEIFRSEASPVTGNLQGDVTIVEFFDYNCPYCRKATPVLAEAAAADPGLRFVFKEWPILGPGSQFAARAALAADVQGKYEAFHKAMMAYSGSIDESSALEVAGAAGLDVERLSADMDDPTIQAELDRNFALAGTLRINGTPSFVIGDEIVRGLVDLDTLKQYVAAARDASTDDTTAGRGE